MLDPLTLRELTRYGDRANTMVFEAAGALPASALDQPIDIGLNSLRRILVHIHSGESVWLARWQGKVETPWPREDVQLAPAEVLANLRSLIPARDAFLDSLTAERLTADQPYRDSRGNLFRATLMQMILQGLVHSIHHRAQAVNAIRRLGGTAPEVDLMYSVRQPA